MRKCFLFVLPCLLFGACRKQPPIINDIGVVTAYQPHQVNAGLEIGEIYSTKNFAAFTDLAHYNHAWYAVFRVGTSHDGGRDGQIKILSSADGQNWKVMNLIALETFDLRDPKFVVDSMHNDLYLSFFGRKQINNDEVIRRNYLMKFDNSLKDWGGIQEIQYDNTITDPFIFWRLTYFKGNMYCVAYRAPVYGGYPDNLCLFVNDGSFTKYKSLGRLLLGGAPNETTLRFSDDNKMYMVVRTETVNSPIGSSAAPNYVRTEWLKDALSIRLASPNFLFYKDKLLITGRDITKGTFKFFSYDPKQKSIEKNITFPAGYETGYGGMSFNPDNPDELWISYYSITDEASTINLAKVDLMKFLN
jgi:hypothetical protein